MRSLCLLLAPLIFAQLGCDMLGSKDADEAEEKKTEDDDDEKKKKKKADDEDEKDAPKGPTGKAHKVGDTIELDGLEVKVAEMRSCKYDKEKFNERLAAKNEKLLGAHFLFKASGSDPVRLRSSYNAHDADKVPYRGTSVNNTDCTPKVRNLKLKPGEAMKGWVGFVVPESAKGLTVTYTHDRGSEDPQLATFEVPD